MMHLEFSKYHGTGNDFILIDQMKHSYQPATDEIKRLCHRRFGIGADGVLLLQPSENADFKMVYYNADGYLGSMCGNGGRCIVHFARHHGYINDTTTFEAIDGIHKAVIDHMDPSTVSLLMRDVSSLERQGSDYLLDTGSPHYVRFVKDADAVDLLKEGRAIRYSSRFSEKGINVNFTEVRPDAVYVRTYERGVEDETLSCGTGVTAAAIAASAEGNSVNGSCNVLTRGGMLNVRFSRENDIFTNVWLKGQATFVFKGSITI